MQSKNLLFNRMMELAEACMQLPVTVVIGSCGITLYRRPSAYPLSEAELQTAKGTFLAACPFHNGTPNGSFKITRTEKENFWFCFKDGFTQANWSVIDFEMRYFGFWEDAWDAAPKQVDRKKKQEARKNAILHLARRFGLMQEDEYRKMSGRSFAGEAFAQIERTVMQRPDEQRAPEKRADPDVIDLVYRTIPQCCPLSVQHIRHLQQVRGLSQAEMKDYFTFPTRRMDLAGNVYRALASDLAKRKYGKALRFLSKQEAEAVEKDPMLSKVKDQFPYVPGFFMDSRGRVSFMAQKGIGFLVKNDFGKAVGIQIRRDDVQTGREAMNARDVLLDASIPGAEDVLRKMISTARDAEGPKDFIRLVCETVSDGEKAAALLGDKQMDALYQAVKRDTTRYVWFSSAFALTMDGCQGGASSSSPGGILYPETVTDHTPVCITEGRFKAVQIAKHGCIAVYVSGVSTWKRIMPMLKRIMKDRKTIYVLFDSDMMGNPAVYGSLSGMALALEEHGWKPVLGLWPIQAGKGFDDLVLSKGSDAFAEYLTYLPYSRFAGIRDQVMKDMLRKYRVSAVREVKDMKQFVSNLQASVEHACLKQKESPVAQRTAIQ